MIESLTEKGKNQTDQRSQVHAQYHAQSIFFNPLHCVCFLFWGAVTPVNISLLRNPIHMKVIKQNKFEISSSKTIFKLNNLEASKIRLDAFYH